MTELLRDNLYEFSKFNRECGRCLKLVRDAEGFVETYLAVSISKEMSRTLPSDGCKRSLDRTRAWMLPKLGRHLKALSPRFQILTALDYVHSLRLIHCDLKPAYASAAPPSDALEHQLSLALTRRTSSSSRTADVKSRRRHLQNH